MWREQRHVKMHLTHQLAYLLTLDTWARAHYVTMSCHSMGRQEKTRASTDLGGQKNEKKEHAHGLEVQK